jgi:hypothetical protein
MKAKTYHAQEHKNHQQFENCTLPCIFIQQFYKPMGISGDTLREALATP